MYEILPTTAAYIAAWGATALVVVRIIKGMVPLIRGIRAATKLVNEQLQPNSGHSLVDKVDVAVAGVERVEADLAAHRRDDHDQNVGGEGE